MFVHKMQSVLQGLQREWLSKSPLFSGPEVVRVTTNDWCIIAINTCIFSHHLKLHICATSNGMKNRNI